MKIVGVAACTVGIAHTYIAQEKLENAAKKSRSWDSCRNTRDHWDWKQTNGWTN